MMGEREGEKIVPNKCITAILVNQGEKKMKIPKQAEPVERFVSRSALSKQSGVEASFPWSTVAMIAAPIAIEIAQKALDEYIHETAVS